MTGGTPAGSRRVLVLNGPNLDRLGRREPAVYGTTGYPELVAACRGAGAQLGLDVQVRQSDCEAELIGWLHEAADSGCPVVLNAGGLTHTSVALRDAAVEVGLLVEVHLSNPAAREPFRRRSLLSGVATGVIAGFGVHSYTLALRAIATGDTPSTGAPSTGAPGVPGSSGPGPADPAAARAPGARRRRT